MRVNPKQHQNRKTFQITFRHPQKQKLFCVSLGTHSLAEAEAICRDLERIADDQTLWADATSPRLLAYHARARRAFFGAESVAEFEAETHPSVSMDDGVRLGTQIIRGLLAAPKTEWVGIVGAAVSQFESEKLRDLFKKFQATENEMKSWRGRAEISEEALYRFQREKSLHVKLSIQNAFEEWKRYYEADHKRQTFNEAVTNIQSFINSLPQQGATLLREATGDHVDAWLQGMSVLAITRKRRKGYLSVFFTYCQHKYKLASNPIKEALPLAGVSRNPENIHAIRRLSDVSLLIEGLKPYPYWRAWVAVALFCGPRYSEQVWLKCSDVYLDEGYIRITSRASGKRIVGTKTGRERNVPIERTILLPILREHLAKRVKQIGNKKSRAEDRSQWLFPATCETGERKLSEAGQWSHNRNWLNQWDTIRKKCAVKNPSEIWTYGPSEWRHSFGTLLAMCGWTGLDVGRAMGNNPAIAERYYIGATAQGNRWPFKWSE